MFLVRSMGGGGAEDGVSDWRVFFNTQWRGC